MAQIVMIPVEKLYPHPDNPRKNIGDVTELANGIKAKGVLQNLTVVPYGEDTYRVIIGHRRLAASKLAGLTAVPCVVAEMTPREQFDTMVVENVQREDLTVYEQAQSFQMMLDMGGTVESVAEQTGFSETTVRNRLKLMKLDQDKLKQTMERGATLQDYMELDKIQNPERRNKVLESIGTPNFNNELKSALNAEELEKKIAYWASLFAPFATRIDKQDYTRFYTVQSFCKWSGTGQETFDVPEDAATEQYFYFVEDGYGVYLYKERKPDPGADERARERAQAEEEYERKKSEFEEISDLHLSLRNDFLMEFSASKKHTAAIEKFALQVIVRADKTWNNVDWQLIADLLDIRMDDDQKKVDPIEYAEAIKRNPDYALLVTAYAYISKDDDKYWGISWDNGTRYLAHKENDKLDMIYQMLTQLGYEMSDEEIAMQKGTYELFEHIPTDEDDEDEFDEDLEDYDDLDEEDDE